MKFNKYAWINDKKKNSETYNCTIGEVLTNVDG